MAKEPESFSATNASVMEPGRKHLPTSSFTPVLTTTPTPTRSSFWRSLWKKLRENWEAGVFISFGAVVGCFFRMFIGRMFGTDCENGQEAVQDFLTPFFQRICITAGGRSEQTGGALFRDLPANIIGCFFIGILTGRRYSSPLPWLHRDHPLQRHTALQSGYTVGLCGSLTTFASWNTQMVIMLDGTHAILGHQIATALFGYILGLLVATNSFRFGTHISLWLCTKPSTIIGVNHNDVLTPRRNDDDEVEESSSRDNAESTAQRDFVSTQSSNNHSQFSKKWKYVNIYWMHMVAVLAIILSVLGDVTYGILPFYRSLTMAVIFAPFGALLRWKLSKWNTCSTRISSTWEWLPIGTLSANIFAAFLSILCQGLSDRYNDELSEERKWMDIFLVAIQSGFAGSLSTVSTFAKELVLITEKYPQDTKSVIYGGLTCLSSMIFCLATYSMIVRI